MIPSRPIALSFVCLALWAMSGCAPSSDVTQQSPAGRLEREVNLDSGWTCMNITSVAARGEVISQRTFSLSGWLPATVPGTVLTTLLNNKLVPDPFYGMNNARIPDIIATGREYYTYWFVKEFRRDIPTNGKQVWLRLRGVNYGCDLFLNGHKLNDTTHYGMFLRQSYNITSLLSKDGTNRLAVLVYPPDPVGDPNGGQGGDGTIGRNVANQFVAGWDWIQPIRDRNTGIWDIVSIEETNTVRLCNPHVITLVPGVRFPHQPQEPAIIKASAEVQNPTAEPVSGVLQCTLDGQVVQREAEVPPHSTVEVRLPQFEVPHPRLWWPNGYGPQNLSTATFRFVGRGGILLDAENVTVGIREVQTRWDSQTRSRQVLVNGQPIFIRGGNWIASDAMFRFSPDRYDAEVRFHRDMNLNLIRIWGGGLTERPEFYSACDKYGILVFQDFWMSGDCNGKWLDPRKKEDQWTRRRYPDDHRLFLASVRDQVMMLRNHPSLAFYCGGNEIPPPEDILTAMQDSLLPALDGTRYFFSYSNVDSMSYNNIGGNGDGTYHVQPVGYFWDHHSFPFNSEIGSVGLSDVESLERFIPPEDLVLPDAEGGKLDSVWRYHKYLGYGPQVDAYGKPATLRDFADKAQLVNYDQYRALMEGHLSHMWEWYTGVIIWKTQNPWTAMRGQMYDYYLDPNAALYGLHHAGEPLHVMCNPTDGMVTIVNNTFVPYHDLMVQAKEIGMDGRDSVLLQWVVEVSPSGVQKINTVKNVLDTLVGAGGGFLDLRLITSAEEVLSENLYWLPDSTGNYSGLQHLANADVHMTARKSGERSYAVELTNPPGNPVAFFNRISLVDSVSGKRILPVFYSDNYISVLPGETKDVTIDCGPSADITNAVVTVQGWNVKKSFLSTK